MRRLLLLRHAKAEQDTGGGDFARGLTDRGRADAARMGHALDTHAWLPDLVFCSSAARTVQTFEQLSAELAKAPCVEFQKTLYLAPPKQIFEAVRKSPAAARAVMVIGHNPGIEDLANRLASKPQSQEEAEHRATLHEKYPTCALAVLDFAVDAWSDIAPGTAALTDFVRPKDVRN
ncbi:MAG TPA: histidine phosphatase family protein [Rhizomicrobium sp.]